ncbi:2214_t:CDS:2, partial [Entrophospora sp. SA101]
MKKTKLDLTLLVKSWPEIVLKIAGFSVSFLKNLVEIIAAGFKPDFNL